MIKLETIWVTHIWALDGPSSEFKLFRNKHKLFEMHIHQNWKLR